ncbi:MAG: tRNA lysidine(34) synthetase TilS [Candidatus Caldatribacteriota bacterium]|nr:tRNA lysidine(34) synthetase TilS [Candidatus Caldatribacteriota bacterium]
MLEEKAFNTIKRFNMLSFNDKVLIGVSGGPDSISLLMFLLSLKEKYHLSIYIAHLNHMLRGKESDKDADFVKKIAKGLNLSCEIKNYDLYKFYKNRSLSLEEAAREYRYRFYMETAKKFGTNKIALGHSSDDQAETVLMRIIRGSGLEGLMGIPPVRGNIIRPLIECTREEIEEYCQKHKIKYRIDSSNKTSVYFRNKIRLELLPLLSRKYNKNIKDNLLRLRNIVSEASGYLQEKTETSFMQIIKEENKDRIIIDLKKLKVLPLALKRRVIRKAIKTVKGNLFSISFKHIYQILKLTDYQLGEKKLNLPEELKIIKVYNELIIYKEKRGTGHKYKTPAFWEHYLSVPGKERIKLLGVTIEIKVFNSREIDPSEYDRREKSNSEFAEFIDFDKVKFPIKIRNRRFGDKFYPINMNGLKKVKKFFIDKKISKRQRNLIPLLVDSKEKILWIAGMRLDDRVKIKANTKKILYVKLAFNKPGFCITEKSF